MQRDQFSCCLQPLHQIENIKSSAHAMSEQKKSASQEITVQQPLMTLEHCPSAIPSTQDACRLRSKLTGCIAILLIHDIINVVCVLVIMEDRLVRVAEPDNLGLLHCSLDLLLSLSTERCTALTLLC